MFCRSSGQVDRRCGRQKEDDGSSRLRWLGYTRNGQCLFRCDRQIVHLLFPFLSTEIQKYVILVRSEMLSGIEERVRMWLRSCISLLMMIS